MKHKLALAAILLSSSTGAVMASNTACRVIVLREVQQAQMEVRRKVRHSAATLARWKVGAAAWSKAHGGKVYAGQPVRRHMDWKPLRLDCDLVPLDVSQPDADLIIAEETLAEFTGYGVAPPSGGILLAEGAPTPVNLNYGWAAGIPVMFPLGVSGGAGGMSGSSGATGASASNAPVFGSSLPSTGAVPPSSAAAPEPSALFLVGTGMVAMWMAKGKWMAG